MSGRHMSAVFESQSFGNPACGVLHIPMRDPATLFHRCELPQNR
jgi:hypothetical protein